MTGMATACLPLPKFEYDCGGIRVTFSRNAEVLSHSEKSSEKSSEKTWQKLLTLVADDPDMTIKQMADQLGLSTRVIEKQLSNLQKKHLLARDGADKGGRWIIPLNRAKDSKGQ